MTFKEKLVILRKSKNLTQDEFASAVGVSRQAVYKWESGQSYPEVPKLLEMKLLFTISIDELLDDSYDIPVPEKKRRKRISKETMRQIEENVEKQIKGTVPKAPKAAPAPKAEPAPAVQPAPKVEPVVIPKVAPAPKAEPAPAPKVEAVAIPKIEATPAPKVEPVAIPKIEATPAPAPAIKIEPEVVKMPEVKEEPVVLEDIEIAPEDRTILSDDVDEEPVKKGGLFGRLFGRK